MGAASRNKLNSAANVGTPGIGVWLKRFERGGVRTDHAQRGNLGFEAFASADSGLQRQRGDRASLGLRRRAGILRFLGRHAGFRLSREHRRLQLAKPIQKGRLIGRERCDARIGDGLRRGLDRRLAGGSGGFEGRNPLFERLRRGGRGIPQLRDVPRRAPFAL